MEVLHNPDDALVAFLDKKIDEFNWQHWEVSERLPLAVSVRNDQGEVIAGAAGRTFGRWFLLDTLWVDDSLRGQGTGEAVLEQIETAAKARGCTQALLDTLNFQAMPFYQKRGYSVQWVQENYPETGCKYFMVKQL